jgi:hypothetical protein
LRVGERVAKHLQSASGTPTASPRSTYRHHFSGRANEDGTLILGPRDSETVPRSARFGQTEACLRPPRVPNDGLYYARVPDDAASADARPAEIVFAELEARMLKASEISGNFAVSAAAGSFSALQGTLEVSRGTDDLTIEGE